jgi:tetratricopeptide (TPR) repeat protein
LKSYAAGAPVFTDDRMTLEFSAPRELHNRNAGENGATLRGLLQSGGPEVVREALDRAGVVQWRTRAEMLTRADVHQQAYADYTRALAVDPNNTIVLDGLVKGALLLQKASEALTHVTVDTPETRTPARLVARSKLLAANSLRDDAIAAAREAVVLAPQSPIGLEQLASLFADSGDTVQLDAAVTELRRVAPQRAATEFYAAVAAFLHGDADAAVASAERALALDANYTPTYDLIGAAYTRLGRLDPARQAFQKSLSFDAHDSTAYENLGVLEFNAGNRSLAAKYFSEALWLVPDSRTARQGLAQSRP